MANATNTTEKVDDSVIEAQNIQEEQPVEECPPLSRSKAIVLASILASSSFLNVCLIIPPA